MLLTCLHVANVGVVVAGAGHAPREGPSVHVFAAEALGAALAELALVPGRAVAELNESGLLGDVGRSLACRNRRTLQPYAVESRAAGTVAEV